MLNTIEGLSDCPLLETLNLKRNRVGLNGLSDLTALLDSPKLSCVDLSENKVDDEQVVDEVFAKMADLRVLYFQNNPAIKKIKNYRKTFIFKIKNLRYLDDRPVFPEERRFCEAFFRGGLQEERDERTRYKEEQKAEHLRQHQAFKDWISSGNVNGDVLLNGGGSVDDSQESSKEQTRLTTYYTDSSK